MCRGAGVAHPVQGGNLYGAGSLVVVPPSGVGTWSCALQKDACTIQCVSTLLVLSVVCCCAQVCFQMSRWLFGSCKVSMVSQPPWCMHALSPPPCPVASPLGFGSNAASLTRCHDDQH